MLYGGWLHSGVTVCSAPLPLPNSFTRRALTPLFVSIVGTYIVHVLFVKGIPFSCSLSGQDDEDYSLLLKTYGNSRSWDPLVVLPLSATLFSLCCQLNPRLSNATKTVWAGQWCPVCSLCLWQRQPEGWIFSIIILAAFFPGVTSNLCRRVICPWGKESQP